MLASLGHSVLCRKRLVHRKIYSIDCCISFFLAKITALIHSHERSPEMSANKECLQARISWGFWSVKSSVEKV